MKRNRLSLILLTLLVAGLVSTLFVSNVNASVNDLDFTFEKSILYSEVSPSFNETFNIRDQMYFTENYNATYSFEDLTSWTDQSDANCNISVLSSFSGHSDILMLTDFSNSGKSQGYQSFSSQNEGYFEFWWATSDTSKYVNSYFELKNGGSIGGRFVILGGVFQYYDAGWQTTGVSISNDVFTHHRIEFNYTADLFDWYINGNLEIDDGNLLGSLANIDNIILYTDSVNTDYYAYYDAIGYSWDNYYEEGYNIVPLSEVNTSLYEIDKYEFSFTEAGGYSTYIDPVPFFTEIDNSEYASDGYVYIWSDNTDNKGIYKNDFNVQDGIINVSINFSYNRMKVHDSYFYFEVYSHDATLIVKLRLHGYKYAPNTITMLSYYDGVSYNNITQINEFNDYNLYINDMVILTNNSIVLRKFPMISNKGGLSEVKFIGCAGANGDGPGMDWYDRIYINSIGIYSNGTSLSEDYYSLTLETNLTWDSNEFYLFKSDIETKNCSITASSYSSLTGDVVLHQSYNYSGEKILNVWDEFTGGDEISGWYKLIDFYLTFVSNETLTINSLEIEGVKLSEGSNEYYLDFEYNNIDIQYSYFWVDSFNRLQYSLTIDDDNVEYIQANFNIIDVESENRSVSFLSNINGKVQGFLSVDYIGDGSTLMEFPYYQTSTNIILPQTEMIESFTILITDNDLSYNTIGTGYISNLRLIYNPDLAVTISTLVLLSVIVPLIILIVPSLAIHKKFGSTGAIIMFILMSVVCVASELIPMWLFFVIAISSIGFLFVKPKTEELF